MTLGAHVVTVAKAVPSIMALRSSAAVQARVPTVGAGLGSGEARLVRTGTAEDGVDVGAIGKGRAGNGKPRLPASVAGSARGAECDSR